MHNESKKSVNDKKSPLNTNYKKSSSNKKMNQNNGDDELDDYKDYINKNENKKSKTNKDSETNEIYDPNIINTLLSQMNSLCII